MRATLVIELLSTKVVINAFSKRKKTNYYIASKEYESIIDFSDIKNLNLFNLVQCINDFIDEEVLSGGNIIFLLSEIDGFSQWKNLTMKYNNESEFKKALPFKIEEEFAISLDDYQFKILKKKKEENFFVHLLNKRVIEGLIFDKKSYLKLKKGWHVDTIIPSYYVYASGLPTNQGSYAILNIYKNEYEILVFAGGRIISGEKSKIYKDFGIDSENIEFSSVMNEISSDINQFLTNVNFMDQVDVSEVVIGSTYYPFEVIPEQISQLFDVTISALNTGSIEISDDVRNDLDLSEKMVVTKYASHIFAFKHVKNTKSLNFAPERAKDSEKGLFALVASFSAIFFISTTSLGLMVDSKVSQTKDGISGIGMKEIQITAEIEQINQRIVDSEAAIKHYNDYVRSIENLSQDYNRYFVSDVLEMLPKNTPSNVIIQTVELSKKSQELKIRGLSNTYTDIGFLAISLEEFGQVEINEVANNELQNKDGYEFEVVLKRS